MKAFLRPDGAIFISIDDNEVAHLRLLLDEVFGPRNHLATFIWNNEGNLDNQSKVKSNHEYVLLYARDANKFERPTVIDPNITESSKLFREEIENSITKNGPANPASRVTLPAGFPCSFENGIIAARQDQFPYVHTQIRVEEFQTCNEAEVESGWSSRNLLQLFINNGFSPIRDAQDKETRFALTPSGAIYSYKRRADDQGHVLTVVRNVGTTKQNSILLEQMGLKFSFPKPVFLIEYLCQILTSPGDTIMDSFSGSGTTGHAVLLLNAKNPDEAPRQFIGVEMSPQIAREVAQPRLKSVVNGYRHKNQVFKEIGGGFRFCTLGIPLFDSTGAITKEASFWDVAHYVFFSETGRPLPQKLETPGPFIGACENISYFLRLDEALDRAFLKSLSSSGAKVVYAPSCRLSRAVLERHNVVFKQLPYEVKTR